MTEYLSNLVALIRISSVLTVVPFAICVGRKLLSQGSFRPLHFYLAGDVICIFLDMYGRKVLRNNSFVYHLSTALDVTTLCWLFGGLLPHKQRRILGWCWAIFALIALGDALWLDPFMSSINVVSRIAGNSLLTMLAMYQIWNLQPAGRPEKNPELVLGAMVLLYYPCSTLVFIVQELLPASLIARFPGNSAAISSMLLYPPLRVLQVGLLIYLLSILPGGPAPRRALPGWLRFRFGKPPVALPPNIHYPINHSK
ncbi:hypothetical protein ACFPAF_15195 [Hymenobacter endophyticus]|uniref:Uncharacterized protein n=1 Tax=Hymenobacter endophyticus TaxID=3076335 RepID=A0ABU3TK45_9BACT|nr:hypothetical protein [Hymenobacter endophyticus]MDU0371747.1 hypothetical protein [Hymenobacter endophyticus]